MFPPQQQKKQGPPAPKRPQAGPPSPGGPQLGGPGGQNPFGGQDPFGGGSAMPFSPPPGSPRPGQGMDAMQAMMQGLGPADPLGAGAPPAQGPPVGPNGLPVGASMPEQGDGPDDMGGSDLLQALAGSLSGGGDPYAVTPGQSDQGFSGMGPGDPNAGIEQLLQLLALGQLGVGGNQGGPAPTPGLDLFGGNSTPNTMGGMVGF